jgi:hypothetical protein
VSTETVQAAAMVGILPARVDPPGGVPDIMSRLHVGPEPGPVAEQPAESRRHAGGRVDPPPNGVRLRVLTSMRRTFADAFVALCAKLVLTDR